MNGACAIVCPGTAEGPLRILGARLEWHVAIRGRLVCYLTPIRDGGNFLYESYVFLLNLFYVIIFSMYCVSIFGLCSLKCLLCVM